MHTSGVGLIMDPDYIEMAGQSPRVEQRAAAAKTGSFGSARGWLVDPIEATVASEMGLLCSPLPPPAAEGFDDGDPLARGEGPGLPVPGEGGIELLPEPARRDREIPDGAANQ